MAVNHLVLGSNPSAGAISIYWKWRQTRDSADRFDPRFFLQKKQPFPEGGSTPVGCVSIPAVGRERRTIQVPEPFQFIGNGDKRVIRRIVSIRAFFSQKKQPFPEGGSTPKGCVSIPAVGRERRTIQVPEPFFRPPSHSIPSIHSIHSLHSLLIAPPLANLPETGYSMPVQRETLRSPHRQNTPLFLKRDGGRGKGKTFFSREKKFSPSPGMPSLVGNGAEKRARPL